MLLKIKKPSDVRSSEITPEKLFLDRRRFLQVAGIGAGAALGSLVPPLPVAAPATLGAPLPSTYLVI